MFESITFLWGKSLIDLFASRLCCQLKPFVSWKPDPEAKAIDVFSLDWNDQNLYTFLPFALINRVLQIVPMWTSQVWFPRLRRLLIDHPLVLPKHPRSLILLFSQGKAHPLQKTLTLLACKSSGTLTQQEAFCKKLPKSSCTLRKGVHRRSIPFTSRSGCSRALQSQSNTSFRFYDGSFLTRPGLQCYEDS